MKKVHEIVAAPDCERKLDLFFFVPQSRTFNCNSLIIEGSLHKQGLWCSLLAPVFLLLCLRLWEAVAGCRQP